jgi:preprotein translocase subunit SecG
MQFLKRQLPVVIAFCAGLTLWAQFFIPSGLSQQALEKFTGSWAIILAGCALILGLLSAIHHHWSKVRLHKPGWGYSLITLFCFSFVVLAGWFPNEPVAFNILSRQYFVAVAFLVIGIILAARYMRDAKAQAGEVNHAPGVMAGFFLLVGDVGLLGVVPLQNYVFTGQTITEGSLFYWIFLNMFVPLDATMFSLLAFFIASAAFRAFRARSFEATALLIAGCIVMIGRVPLGEQLSFSLAGNDISFASVAGWILNNPNAAAQRGILLGVLLSMVAISLRIMFGIERTYMGGAD